MSSSAATSKPLSSDDATLKGRLTVTLHGCRDLYVHNLLSTPDPYAELEMASEKFKTKVAKDQGSTPVWEQGFLFNADGSKFGSRLRILVKNEGTLVDDTVGRVDLNVHECISKFGYGKHEYELRDKDNFAKLKGFIAITFESFTGESIPPLPAKVDLSNPPLGHKHNFPHHAAHPLEFVSEPYGRHAGQDRGFNCDKCRQHLKGNDWHCHTCQFDLCKNCAVTK